MVFIVTTEGVSVMMLAIVNLRPTLILGGKRRDSAAGDHHFSCGTLEFVPSPELHRGGTQLFFCGSEMSCGQNNLLGSLIQTGAHMEVWSGTLFRTCGFDLLEKGKI